MPRTSRRDPGTTRSGVPSGTLPQAIACSVSAPAELKYDVFFANSRNRWGYRDLTHAEEAVGFVPQDSAEDHRQ